jgi:hypothetical protein
MRTDTSSALSRANGKGSMAAAIGIFQGAIELFPVMAPTALETGYGQFIWNEVFEVGMNIKTLGLPPGGSGLSGIGRLLDPTVVTLQNGTQYLTKDMPKTKNKDGFYEFEDISGTKVKVRADEVATVRKED